jgi:hypothetical protein
MTRAEITLYNLGRRLYEAATTAIAEGRGDRGSPDYILSREETAAMARVGQDEALRLMRMGIGDH